MKAKILISLLLLVSLVSANNTTTNQTVNCDNYLSLVDKNAANEFCKISDQATDSFGSQNLLLILGALVVLLLVAASFGFKASLFVIVVLALVVGAHFAGLF